MVKQVFKGRLFGHPIHPMLVHFPTALFIAGFCFDAAGLLGCGEPFFRASVYCTGAGLTGGLLAGLFGFIDYVKLADEYREEVFVKASWHGGIQLLVLFLFGIVFGLRYETLTVMSEPRWFEMVLSGSGVVLMLAGNYLGGDLVFRDGVGVSRPPG